MSRGGRERGERGSKASPSPERATRLRASSKATSPNRARLLVVGTDAVESFPLPSEGSITIGRSLKADVRLDDDLVSRIHAILTIKPATGTDPGLRLKDMGSSNGTQLSGKGIEAHQEYVFEPGDPIDIGATTLIVKRGRMSAGKRAPMSREDFQRLVQDACSRRQEFALLRVSIKEQGAWDGIEEGLTALLASEDAFVQLEPFEYEIYLSEGRADHPAQAETAIRSGLSRLGAEAAVGVARHPRDGRDLDELSARAVASSRRTESATQGAGRAVVLEDEAIQEIFRLADRVAGSNISVLILGETGVGKEVLARTIHERSKRAEKPFLALNCGALPEDLLESELFGHERGAFTGALKAKVGLLESADGGTVLLDEIGEMPASTQVSLLRVLEERRVRPVGGLESRSIDVRFIAATHRDLEREIGVGTFRQDLFYRLAGFSLLVPPLRERKKDIPVLARAFAFEFWRREGRSGEPTFGEDALDLLDGYAWPGNVRELRNVIERAVVLAGSERIAAKHLPIERLSPSPEGAFPPDARRSRGREARDGAGAGAREASNALQGRSGDASMGPRVIAALGSEIDRRDADQDGDFPTLSGKVGSTGRIDRTASADPSASLVDDVERYEQEKILAALTACGGNQTRAAKMLGITRRALIIRLDRYGLDRPRKGRHSSEE